jgi:hypothetical protein
MMGWVVLMIGCIRLSRLWITRIRTRNCARSRLVEYSYSSMHCAIYPPKKVVTVCIGYNRRSLLSNISALRIAPKLFPLYTRPAQVPRSSSLLRPLPLPTTFVDFNTTYTYTYLYLLLHHQPCHPSSTRTRLRSSTSELPVVKSVLRPHWPQRSVLLV